MRRDEGKVCLAHSSGHRERSRQLWPKHLEAQAMLWSLRCVGLCYPGQWPAPDLFWCDALCSVGVSGAPGNSHLPSSAPQHHALSTSCPAVPCAR